MKNLVLILFALLTLISCKREKKTKKIEIENETMFSLNIQAIIKNDDEFILYFLDEEQENITKGNSVSMKVLGAEDPQELRFQLKDNILPTKLILKFGNEQKAQKISFLTTIISYGDESFTIDGSIFYQFFSPNGIIEFDKESSTAVAKEKEGKYNPSFISRQILDEKIDFLFN